MGSRCSTWGARLSAGFVYSFGKTDFLRALLSNWESSGILTFQDGSPENPFYFGTDFANTGTPNRPNIVPGQSLNRPGGPADRATMVQRERFLGPATLHVWQCRPQHLANSGRRCSATCRCIGVFRFTNRRCSSFAPKASMF